jgi:trehalose/maltose hydrolase-like predicted phosphorylase
VIKHSAFVVEPWAVRETALELDKLAQTESVFALGNGHLGLRGNLDEGEPAGLPGTYLGGFYEVRPLPYAEAGYGFPEAGQAVINVTNGKLIRLLVEDEPLDIRYGTLRKHERVLDLRAGVLHRTLEWLSPTERPVRISSTRSRRSTAGRRSSCNQSSSPTRSCRSPRATPGLRLCSPLHCSRCTSATATRARYSSTRRARAA